MSLLSELVSLFGIHSNNPQPQHTEKNPQSGGQQVAQMLQPQGANLQPAAHQIQTNVGGNETQGGFVNQYPAADSWQQLLGVLHGLHAPSDFGNPGQPAIQGQTNPGFIPLQNSGFGGGGSAAGMQPTVNPGLNNLFRQ